jgi:hypothetical protein
MSVPARLGLFGALLAGVFGLALLLGNVAGPEAQTAQDPAHATQDDAPHGGGRQGAEAGHDAASEGSLPGLAVAQDGVRLVLDASETRASSRARVAFRLVDEQGRDVRDLEVAHEKRMHLIVVRRDLAGFQHLHPEQAPDGTWSARADLSAAGTYRVFADFTRGGEQHTLGADLQVPGAFRPQALEAPATSTRDDRGLEVRVRRDGGRVAFDVVRDGRTITDRLDPYLGAKGHLVTLRTGDLAYLHTHPEGDELAFETELPTSGIYRLWVQFQLDGRIHTAAFTQEVTS